MMTVILVEALNLILIRSWSGIQLITVGLLCSVLVRVKAVLHELLVELQWI